MVNVTAVIKAVRNSAAIPTWILLIPKIIILVPSHHQAESYQWMKLYSDHSVPFSKSQWLPFLN